MTAALELDGEWRKKMLEKRGNGGWIAKPGQHQNHPPFAAHKRALKCLACLQYRGMFRIAVSDPGSMQFRNVKKGIDVKPLGVSAHMQHSVCEVLGLPPCASNAV